MPQSSLTGIVIVGFPALLDSLNLIPQIARQAAYSLYVRLIEIYSRLSSDTSHWISFGPLDAEGRMEGSFYFIKM